MERQTIGQQSLELRIFEEEIKMLETELEIKKSEFRIKKILLEKSIIDFSSEILEKGLTIEEIDKEFDDGDPIRWELTL